MRVMSLWTSSDSVSALNSYKKFLTVTTDDFKKLTVKTSRLRTPINYQYWL